MENAIDFPHSYPLDSDLSGGLWIALSNVQTNGASYAGYLQCIKNSDQLDVDVKFSVVR